MKNMKLYLSAFMLILLMACAGGSEGGDHYSEEQATEGSAPTSSNYEYDMAEDAAYDYKEETKTVVAESGKDIPLSTQMLIKTGNIGFETEDVYETRTKVNMLIKQFNAYVSSESEDYYGNRINQYITIRIPNKYFEPFVDGVCDGVDKFDNKNLYVEDVTDEFVDTETRIANKKALEQKYISLLEKANSIEDILEIEKEINYLREDIELAEAHLKNLSSQISYSTLDLYIYERTSEVTHTEEPENRFILGLQGGWEAVIDFLVWLTYTWPAMIVWIIVFLIGRRLWKNKIKPKYFDKD